MPITLNGSGTITPVSAVQPTGSILQVLQVAKTDVTQVQSSGNNDYSDIPSFSNSIEKQVVTDAHYMGYLERQDRDIQSFKKDESVIIPNNINYENLSGLSNEVKSKLISIRPKTLGQAIRIDGITPAAIIILLSHIKKLKFKATA